MTTRKPTEDEPSSEDQHLMDEAMAEEVAEPPTPAAGVVYANPGPPSAASSEEGGR